MIQQLQLKTNKLNSADSDSGNLAKLNAFSTIQNGSTSLIESNPLDGQDPFIGIYHDILDLVKDVSTNDPATSDPLEVLAAYPGVQAIFFHRLAHQFWLKKVPFIPRYLANTARNLTGIDIHPGAELGKRVFIDHGMGVVIGETARIGNDVTIYHGVTLGCAKLSSDRRHPTVGNRVMIGAGAKLLGNIQIGDDAQIGANSVVLCDVPNNSTAIGSPAKIFPHQKNSGQSHSDMLKMNIPEEIQTYISQLEDRIQALESGTFPIEKRG